MEIMAFYKRLDAITDLPTLPQAALEMNRLLDSPGVTIDQVAGTILKDQAVAVKILRLVNSSFFGLETKVSSINRAVVILGFNTVRNALVSVSIIDALKGAHNDLIKFSDFWRHTISCAVISKYLALRCKLGAPEDAFTAGLIHDIGKLVLLKYFPKEFINILEKVNSGQSFYDAEGIFIPVHHNQIGAYLAERWRLPPVICNAIKYSHGKFDPDEHSIACVVYCAEKMLEGGMLSAPMDAEIDLPRSEIMNQLRKEIDNRREWLVTVNEEIESACLFLMEGGDSEN